MNRGVIAISDGDVNGTYDCIYGAEVKWHAGEIQRNINVILAV